jgi:hypothetical protein
MAALFALMAGREAKAEIIFFNGTFLSSNYSLTTLTQGAGGTVSVGQSTTGGNPGAFRSITNIVNNPVGGVSPVIAGWHINITFVSTPTIDGAIGSIFFLLRRTYHGGSGRHWVGHRTEWQLLLVGV